MTGNVDGLRKPNPHGNWDVGWNAALDAVLAAQPPSGDATPRLSCECHVGADDDWRRIGKHDPTCIYRREVEAIMEGKTPW